MTVRIFHYVMLVTTRKAVFAKSSGIASVPTSGNLILACGHFLSENGVPDTVQFYQGFLSPQRPWMAGLHCFKVSRGTFVRKST